jgi:hypothetical protein
MKLTVNKLGLVIRPESPQDEVYLESVLGLKHEGDSIPLVRENALGLMSWYGAVTHPMEAAK